MTKILVVFGATGQQGGSVVDYVLGDRHLSAKYSIRAVTRDVSKPAARALSSRGIEVIEADADDPQSLKSAMHGASTTFVMTTPTFSGEKLEASEITRGKAIADAAVAAGLEYIIFSSLPASIKISGGKYTGIAHFDAKAEVEEYIRGLPIKSAIYTPGWFMQNFTRHMGPQLLKDGTFAILNIVSPYIRLPLIDIVADTGKFIGPILAEPDKFEGQVLSAASVLYTYEEIVQLLSKSSGKTVEYKQITGNPFKNMPPSRAEMLLSMMPYLEECGYYGPQTKELVEATGKNAEGKLTTLEEYLAREPLVL
ncbi:hypothetical protein V495_03617 [Pseudogymnoascus sp. VKM F-4514 (FW-929)]|nr:hypothetical protein V495_03617 [Pseudogymnoascus sp. VKM F-4514 (FW-929)]KFY66449.1 hypothetical protein V497_00905 [Pseudogymnoascus sp. VKM F-4516 (FW-969)]